MSRIDEAGEHGARCTACGRPSYRGAVYHGHGDVVLCGSCSRAVHMLGILIGDAARSSQELRQTLAAIERQAWESYALQVERRASAPRLIGTGDSIPY